MKISKILAWTVGIFVILYGIHELSVYLSKKDKMPLTCPYLEKEIEQ